MSFDSLGLSTELLRAVADQGYSQPTPIQTKAIPVVLDGRDLLAGAQTGTGKTAAVTRPLLQLLDGGPTHRRRPLRALVLTPTRELAAQVGESITTYGSHLSLRSAVVFGGVNINPQIKALRGGLDILVATPGRLLDHVGRGTIDLGRIEILVLDEADRMLDMGFIHDIKKVLALLPAKKQSLLFSATYSREIESLAQRLLHEPISVSVTPRNTTVERIVQRVHPVDRARKRELLSHLIQRDDWRQVLVFTRTKHGANRLAKQLVKDGISAVPIHGNKSQGARTKALADFKRGAVRVLVATDIAARGLDIDRLPHVVNFELPHVAEDYVHRIGRTGRAGRDGGAVSLVCSDEHDLLRGIERLLKAKLSQEVIPGFAPDPTIAPEPIRNGRNRQAGAKQETGTIPRQQGRKRPAGKKRVEDRTARTGSRSDLRPESKGRGTDGAKKPARNGRRGSSQSDTTRPSPFSDI